MEPQGHTKATMWVIVAAVILLALLVSGYLYFQNNKKATDTPSVNEAIQSLSGNSVVSQLEGVSNPLENELPELNPVEATNPFKYKNPFQ